MTSRASRTIQRKRITKDEQRIFALLYPERFDRPRTRADCEGGQRPCPFVGCRHHLYADVNLETGSIKINFPDREVWGLEHSCSLDLADAGTHTLEEVGEILNVTRERTRQIEAAALAKMREDEELDFDLLRDDRSELPPGIGDRLG